MAAKKKSERLEAKATFEDGMKALEGLVNELESGDLPLEKALESYEKGVGLVRSLNARLNEAEKKIELLSRDGSGELTVDPLDDGDADE